MKVLVKSFTTACSIGALLLPIPSLSADPAALTKKIDSLSRELEELKQQMRTLQQGSVKEERVTDIEKKIQGVEKKTREAGKSSTLEISGDYRFRFDAMTGSAPAYYNFGDVMAAMQSNTAPALRPAQDYKNKALLTNRLGLNFKAKATEDVMVKARLLMYKIWGHTTSAAATGSESGGPFFTDKYYAFDGNVGHVPQDNILRVDQAYATWTGIGGAPVWLSVGRRPSTGGVPTNLRQNIDKNNSETAGVPGLPIDYAFDGATIGFAPEIAMLPGAYTKICYGKGFDSGFVSGNTMKDVNFLGLNLVPYATDNLRVELQWDRAYNIFAFPESNNLDFGKNRIANTNLGDIDQFMIGVSGKLEDLGPGDLNLFLSAALSKTHPNDNLMMNAQGLMYDSPAFGGVKESKSGNAFYLGGRYDIKPIRTKLGLEYNHGSENWISFTPASDDMWTAKQGVHGNVYEAYLIHDLNSKPVSKLGKAQIRLGYQYYDFKYTGSNNWVGAPKNIDELSNPANVQIMTPLEDARNIYLTFDVTF